jgi:hypothetical protein
MVPLVCVSRLVLAQPAATDASALPIADPKLATIVVARVGPDTITASEFLLSYEFGPAFAKREKNSKRRYLEFMMNERLLALDAAARGGRSVPDVQYSVNEIVGDLATEELYRDDILNKVRVQENELREAINAQRVHCSFRWLFSTTREGIEDCRRALAKGAPFDTLFASQLGDSLGADVRSWDATRFKLRTLRPALAAVVDTIAPHRASAPVEGPDGWYIIAVDDVSVDAITTDAAAMQQREDARRALIQQKADSLSDLYVNGIMTAHSPVIERRTFDLLSAYLAQFWLREDARSTMLQGLSIDRETALSAIADIQHHAAEPLVKMTDRAVTLGRFLSWYRAREFVLRLRATSVNAFQISLQQTVWRMVRDGLLMERAMGRGLQKSESVRTQRKWWENKVLYAYEKKMLADTVKPDGARLARYFQAHRRSYRNDRGDTLSFQEAEEQVRKDWYAEEVNGLLLHRLIALKRKYPVVVFEKILSDLPVANESDPRAIDVYFAKKGGTFPHPAFPAIDYDWQSWE